MIAQEVNESGYTFTGEQCDLKFRNLKKTYKRIVDSNNKTGRGTKTWPYFQQFNRLFSKDPEVQPVAIVGNREVEKQHSHMDPLVVEEVTDSPRTVNADTPTSKIKRKRESEVEPEWVKLLRKDAAERHAEKNGSV